MIWYILSIILILNINFVLFITLSLTIITIKFKIIDMDDNDFIEEEYDDEIIDLGEDI